MSSKKDMDSIAEKQALMAKIRKRAAIGKTYWSENWENAERDLNFLDGQQWSAEERAKRQTEGRPCITNNVLPTFVDAVIGDARQDRSRIKTLQTGFKSAADLKTASALKIANVEETKSYPLADALDGLIRQIEYVSDAETAYDCALENSVQSSLGYLRVYSDWADQNSFDQHVLIKNIDNQFNVILDPLATEFDFSDMNWAIVDSMVDKDDFERDYPDANTSTAGLTDANDWITDNAVRVSEYFEREPYEATIHLMSDGSVLEDKNYQAIQDELKAKGITSTNTRKATLHRVMWRKVTAHDVLKGPTPLPCSTVPIIPVFGKRIVIKNRKQYKSFIRNGLDAQLQANYFESAATESVALSPKAPYIASAHHVEDNLTDWENANKETKAVLVYKAMHESDPGPRRQAPAVVPAAEITLGMNAIEKIKSTIGMYDASLGAAGNETSGKAIIARQRQGDRGSYAFLDNLNKAKRRVGKLVIEWVMNTYDGERVEKLRFDDGSEDYIVLNQMIKDEQSQKWYKVNDFSVSSFEAMVDAGPSYATQRAESADILMNFSQAFPTIGPLIADLVAANLDINGAKDISQRIKKTQPMELLGPEDRKAITEERQQAQEEAGEQPPPPEVILKQLEDEIAKAKIQAEQIKAEVMIAKGENDLALAEIERDRVLAESTIQAQGQAEDMEGRIRLIVADALAELLSQEAPPTNPDTEQDPQNVTI